MKTFTKRAWFLVKLILFAFGCLVAMAMAKIYIELDLNSLITELGAFAVLCSVIGVLTGVGNGEGGAFAIASPEVPYIAIALGMASWVADLSWPVKDAPGWATFAANIAASILFFVLGRAVLSLVDPIVRFCANFRARHHGTA